MSSTDRRWLEIRARSPAAGDRAALLADALVGLGARGVEERSGWFVSYFAEPADVDGFLAEAARWIEAESGLSDVRLEHGWQAHEAWEETWKRGLTCRRVSERILVHPSWAPPADTRKGDIVITIDPGMAFGTAEHGTTRGCLRLLDGTVRPGDRLLDVGAGSGILAIAAALLGADDVVAIEGDALACEALVENLERNAANAVRIVEEWATSDSIVSHGPVRGIIANIESGLLRPLFEGFARALETGGWLLVSGILEHEWEEVDASLTEIGFRLRAVDADGEWRSGLYDRLATAR